MSKQSNTMSRLSFFFIGILAVVNQSARATDVYIVAGQSNGWRVGSLAELPNGAGKGTVVYYPMACGTRPDKTKPQHIKSVHPSCQGRFLAEGLLKHSGGDIIVVQYCVCGSSLHDKDNWYPGDDPKSGQVNDAGLFSRFLKFVADARRQAEADGHEWDVKALFWHQGESDSNEHAKAYEDNFRRLVFRFRKELKADLPIIAGHVRALSDAAGEVNCGLDAVATGDPLVAIVPTADLTPEAPTDVHFNTEGCHELGRRMATAYSKLVKSATSP